MTSVSSLRDGLQRISLLDRMGRHAYITIRSLNNGQSSVKLSYSPPSPQGCSSVSAQGLVLRTHVDPILHRKLLQHWLKLR